MTVNKYEWVTDGEAKRDDGWGGWDNFTWTNPLMTSVWGIGTTLYSDNFGDYIYPAVMKSEGTPGAQDTQLICVSHDGDVVFQKKDFPGRYFPGRVDPEGKALEANMWIRRMDYSRTLKNHWKFGHVGCLSQFLNFSRILVDPEDDTDLLVWHNSNGDYYMDTGSKLDAIRPWDCMAGPEESSEIDIGAANWGTNGEFLDKYNFALSTLNGEDFIEIAMLLPDGTGIGEYMRWSDTVSKETSAKSAIYVMNGGKYDGIYTAGLHPVGTNEIKRMGQSYFSGADNFRGVITSQILTAVEADAVSAFSVAQNMPNPFNPTTTINFTISKAGNVTVDVYNVAGQKVATLANGSMNAGTHSLVWDASGHSAGVYFYTVKAGDFSKTMKMALLK